MDYVRLGSSGSQSLPPVSGRHDVWRPEVAGVVLPEDAARPFIKRSLDARFDFFDTADMYSLGKSEEVLGRALRELAQRDNVVIATKVFNPMSDDPRTIGDCHAEHIMTSIDRSSEASSDRLRRSVPNPSVGSGHTHEETLQALHDVVRAGKARYIGASSMAAWQFASALHLADLHGWTRFVSMQNHYNLVYREEEREMLPLCRHEGIGVIPWSPLARGFLAGNRKRGANPSATTREQTDTDCPQPLLLGCRLRRRGARGGGGA